MDSGGNREDTVETRKEERVGMERRESGGKGLEDWVLIIMHGVTIHRQRYS